MARVRTDSAAGSSGIQRIFIQREHWKKQLAISPMPYELKLDRFSGPLEKLLELIESRELEITEISLARVTEDFLSYLRTITEAKMDLRLVADFIAVAGRLIFLKSKSLLPDLKLTGDEEAEIKDLEKRLKLYQELKPALKIVARLWSASASSFSRPYFLLLGQERSASVFYPGRKLNIKALTESLDKLFASFKSLELETQTIKEKIITIEEKVEEIIKRLQDGAETKFANLSKAKSRSEIIAIFLAILHLAREQLILLEQSERFSDIVIRKK